MTWQGPTTTTTLGLPALQVVHGKQPGAFSLDGTPSHPLCPPSGSPKPAPLLHHPLPPPSTTLLGPQGTLHSVHGRQQLGAFSLGAEVAGEGVALACSYPHGLAVLTAASSSVWAVEGLAQPRPHRLAGLPAQFQGLAPTALAVVDPAHPVSGCLEVCGLWGLPAWVAAAHQRCAAGGR